MHTTTVAHRHMELLHGRLAPAMPVSLLAGLLLIVALRGQVAWVALLGWYALLCALVAGRYALLALARPRLAHHPERWLSLFELTLAAVGGVWGTVAWLVPPDGTYLLFAALWLYGVAAVTTHTYGVSLAGCAGFVALALTPAVLRLLAAHSDPLPLVGGALVPFAGFLVYTAARNRAILSRSFAAELESQRLMAALDEKRRHVEDLNAILRSELIAGERAAAELQRAKESAEQLAARQARLSFLDGLTGIANRRHFDEALRQEWSRAQRHGAYLALILCDIDHFKRYNDRYGHQQGDDCLRTVASVLGHFCRRGGDLAARYGGEEFALLLPATEPGDAERLAGHIRGALEGLAMAHEAGGRPGIVTASFGVAALVPGHGQAPAELVRLADEALYRAKAAGRNTVRHAGAPLAVHG